MPDEPAAKKKVRSKPADPKPLPLQQGRKIGKTDKTKKTRVQEPKPTRDANPESEYDVHTRLIRYCRHKYARYCFRGSIMGAFRPSPGLLRKCHELGYPPGEPDFCMRVARGKYHSCNIEIKVGGNKPSRARVDKIRRLRRTGNFACVAYGFKACKAVLDHYMNEEMHRSGGIIEAVDRRNFVVKEMK